MSRERLERKDLPALIRGECDHCGNPAKPRSRYCSSECAVAYGNLMARQGKSVMHMLKIWRKNRGAKGTPGEGMIGEITSRLDLILEEDRERKKSLRGKGE